MSDAPDPSSEGSERPASELSDETLTAFSLPAKTAQRGGTVGAYQLLQLLGEGGMGEVWLAEQQRPVRRQVAVKLIKAGMDTREVVSRFQYERQALALMNHPAIAKVFDAGSSSQGRPYFVMEYVTGIPITQYCDDHRLNTRQRLQLFVQVCEGVQHAHRRAILHRDLKPSNILVTEVDGEPVPKIIDFGVAKATSQPFGGETVFTRVGSIVGTPEYMSPEQANSAGEDVDTRTDVYSLGVVLYELLVGQVPLQLRKLPLHEMLTALREQAPLKPSTKLRISAEALSAAENRGTNVALLRRELRGDLDAIASKALAKERAQRYPSAADLALDIGRYLGNEPVSARPAGFVYRARKYAQRHRLAVGIAAGLLVLVTSFGVAQALQLQRTARERDRADRITAFMTSMFKVSNPSESRGSKVTAREILDKASADIGRGLANDPELQAQMTQVMGTVYWNLGLYSRAEPLFKRSLEARQRLLGPDNPDTLESMNSLARLMMDEGHYADAERLHRETLTRRRRVLGPANLDTISSASGLANALGAQGHYAESERLQREALTSLRTRLGPDNLETLRVMSNLGTTLNLEAKYADARVLHREALDIERRTLGADHFETLRTMANLASDEGNLGRFGEAAALDGEALEIQKRVLGPEHPDTLRSMSALANDLTSLGRYDEAERQLLSAREVQRRVLGPDHPDTATSTYELALVAVRRGNAEQALALLNDSIEHGLDPTTLQAMADDPDLKPLHGNPRFADLVAIARRHAAPAQRR